MTIDLEEGTRAAAAIGGCVLFAPWTEGSKRRRSLPEGREMLESRYL